MKKVMIFSSVHSHNDSRVFYKEAVSLARAGYRVELHALADFEQREEQGVKIIGLPRPKNRVARLLSGWRLFRRARSSGADRFHFHDPELLPWGFSSAGGQEPPSFTTPMRIFPNRFTPNRGFQSGCASPSPGWLISWRRGWPAACRRW